MFDTESCDSLYYKAMEDTGHIKSLEISPDRKNVATSYKGSKDVNIWNTETCSRVGLVKIGDNSLTVNDCALSSCSKYLGTIEH